MTSFEMAHRMLWNIVARRALYYSNIIMSAMAPQITGVSIVYSTVCSGANQKKTHQSSALLAFVRGLHRWPAPRASYVENVDVTMLREAGHSTVFVRPQQNNTKKKSYWSSSVISTNIYHPEGGRKLWYWCWCVRVRSWWIIYMVCSKWHCNISNLALNEEISC